MLEYNKVYCNNDLQRLKDNGSIDRRIFSLKELTDTHGEIVIGDITKTSKEKDFPLLIKISLCDFIYVISDSTKLFAFFFIKK